jgi:hypothetical protein
MQARTHSRTWEQSAGRGIALRCTMGPCPPYSLPGFPSHHLFSLRLWAMGYGLPTSSILKTFCVNWQILKDIIIKVTILRVFCTQVCLSVRIFNPRKKTCHSRELQCVFSPRHGLRLIPTMSRLTSLLCNVQHEYSAAHNKTAGQYETSICLLRCMTGSKTR